MDSILTSIKKLLGIEPDYTVFDTDLIIHINSVFSILNQLGIGPDDGFVISDENSKWDEYINGLNNIEMVKTYVYLKVRLIFDPPASGTATECINKQIAELEWRLTSVSDLRKE